MGFIQDVFKTMSKFQIDVFFKEQVTDYILYPKTTWKKFIKNVIAYWYYDKWRHDLSSKVELKRYSGIHVSMGPNPILSLCTKFPKHCWKLVDLMLLSVTNVTEEVICRLCAKKSIDIVSHLLTECPVLYMTRDAFLEQVVNVINVKDYVTFSSLEDNSQTDFLLGCRTQVQLDDEEWKHLMLVVSDGIDVQLSDMNSKL